MAILHTLLLEFVDSGPVSLIEKVILMAIMVLHLLDADIEVNVSELSRKHGVSREILYEWGYSGIALLGMGCIPDQPGRKSKAEPESIEAEEAEQLKEQVNQLQQENDRLRFKIQELKGEVARLTVQMKEIVDKAIIVLRLSGKVSYRGIEECIRLLFGVHVPAYVIKEKLSEAAEKAEGVLPQLLASIQVVFAGLDEVYLKEQGRRIYGLLVTELASRAIISLTKATNRTSDSWVEALKSIPQLKDSLGGIVTDLARAFPALARKLKDAWQREEPLLHQLCNVHAFRKLFEFKALAWQPYKKAKERYQQAKEALSKKPHLKEVWHEYWSARQLRNFHWRMSRYVLTLSAQLITALSKPTRQAAEAALDKTLAQMALLPADYQPWVTKTTDFINRYRAKLLLHYDFLGLDWTTNSCEGAFSVLRRFVTVYKAFPSPESVEQFFALFVLYYNLKPQHYADGTFMSPLAKAGGKVEGNYLHYLGYSTLKTIISYSKLPSETTLSSPATILNLSTEFKSLSMAA
jgi:hypothetical protein